MNFKIKKEDLADVLSKIQGLAGRKSNLAITANVLIKTTEQGLFLAATDLETGFEGYYPCQMESEGAIALNARKLYEIIRDFPSDEVSVREVENRWIEIGNKNIEYHLVGMNPDDFPSIPKIEDAEFFDIQSQSLKDMIEKTLVIGASDDKRAHIVGVLFERVEANNEKIIRMVSTDGSRLSTVDVIFEADVNLPTGPGVIVPKKGLNEVNKFLEAGGQIQIGLKDNNFIVKKAMETIIIRLLEGEFPAYKEIIVKEKSHQISLDRQMFLMMLKRMSILSSENYKGVIFNFYKDRLMISSSNPELGESKEDMIIAYDGSPMEIAFNPRYFIDALSAIDEKTVILQIDNEEKPCLIEGGENKNFVSVIMPMRI